MCGIAGIVDLKASREIDRAALERMTKALAHRGPDGEGYFTAPGVGFGHQRLAIIDIDGGAQPFHSKTRDCVLSFNGEIYNYRTLANNLSSCGFSARTQSDTEILAEGLARKGADFVHSLRGMFAFSFWESDKSRLTLARDRLGERPLYYAETDDGFLLFASEIGALLASRRLNREINPQAVADYFFYGYVPDPKTIYRGIHKLPPAHILTAEPGQAIQLERYWRPVFAAGDTMSFHGAARILLEEIDEAVCAQMISDAPLGAFLSGGADSAGIVSAMQSANGDLITCTIGFDEASHDERSFARQIADKFDTNHHEYIADLDAMALIDDVASACGEPFADSSALPGYLLAQHARQHVKAALSGDGGDELFAGYRRYPFFLAEEQARRVAPPAVRRAIFGPAGALYPKLDWAPRPIRFKTTFQALALSQTEGYAAAVAINTPANAAMMLSRDLHESLQGYRPHDVIANAMADADTDDTLARAQYADLMTWLPGRILTKTDRTSMAHGLEVRPPLLDHQLVEWAGLLPASYKLQNGERKRILKEALAPRLGQSYLNRPKQGFAPPLTEWLRRKSGNPLLRLNASRHWRESGLLNEQTVDRMVREHQGGAANYAQELWTVIMFDAFLRNIDIA
ncbi:MAG: asparagine synthase (glutamine-hydrolyzing) [Pseudomonadota bacterium]